MQDGKKDTDMYNGLLDSEGEGEGGMLWENGILTCILSCKNRIASLCHPHAPAPSMLYPASDIDWRFDSYMIVYMLECHSPKSSHPLPLPLSPLPFKLSILIAKFRLKLKKAGKTTGEGNGTPLQYSCLESPMDGGAW